jgi:hypothetical protein
MPTKASQGGNADARANGRQRRRHGLGRGAQQVEALQKRIDEMGPVNLVAIEEYEETEQRHQFLTQQYDDLVNAKTELLEIINRINTQTRQMFLETFEKIRDNFRLMFTEVFGGGKADLFCPTKTTCWKAASTSWPVRPASSCRAFRCCPAANRP